MSEQGTTDVDGTVTHGEAVIVGRCLVVGGYYAVVASGRTTRYLANGKAEPHDDEPIWTREPMVASVRDARAAATAWQDQQQAFLADVDKRRKGEA